MIEKNKDLFNDLLRELKAINGDSNCFPTILFNKNAAKEDKKETVALMKDVNVLFDNCKESDPTRLDYEEVGFILELGKKV